MTTRLEDLETGAPLPLAPGSCGAILVFGQLLPRMDPATFSLILGVPVTILAGGDGPTVLMMAGNHGVQ